MSANLMVDISAEILEKGIKYMEYRDWRVLKCSHKLKIEDIYNKNNKPKMSLTKEQLAEWAQREAGYYAEAEKWKRVQERMKREQVELESEWKRRDIFNQYTQEEINEAVRQIRIDRLKIILNPYK